MEEDIKKLEEIIEESAKISGLDLMDHQNNVYVKNYINLYQQMGIITYSPNSCTELIKKI